MKKILTLTLALAAGLVAFAQTPASTNVPTKEYPCVDAEGRATFQIAAPTATDVQVDICNKKYPLTKDEKGVWTGTTDPLVVGFHYYALLVDGVRVNDPNSETFYGCSQQTSGIEIPEKPEVAAYYTFNPARSRRRSAPAMSIPRPNMSRATRSTRCCTSSTAWARTSAAGTSRATWPTSWTTASPPARVSR